jgi:hypothetical protein
VGTLLSLAGNCNRVGHGSTTEVRLSMLMAVESGAACVGADNAAIERMPSMEACAAVEMWRPEFTSYNTRAARFSPRPVIGFFPSGDRGYATWRGLPTSMCRVGRLPS